MLEYVLGRHPLEDSGDALIEPSYGPFDGQQRLRLDYRVRTMHPFYRVSLETSLDLVVWEDQADQFEEDGVVSLGDGLQEIRVYWIGPQPSERIHVRLRVDRISD